MTANTHPESKSPSRRALLAGALGGLGALAATAIGRVRPVRAVNGDPTLLGTPNFASSTTSISNQFGAETAIVAYGAGAGASGWSGGNSSGLIGYSNDGAGVLPAAKAKTGVFGYAAQDATSRGVWGQSSGGIGVYGQSTTGVALQAAGRTKLSTSGAATINAGSSSKVITPGVNVTSSSFVLLTASANIGTRALWFTTDASGNKFTIHMSSSRSSSTKVAWLLLG
jgi:hypothetical protein